MTLNPPEPESNGGPPTPAAIAATESPVQLTVGLVDDQRVPDGMVCMGSYRNGRLVARVGDAARGVGPDRGVRHLRRAGAGRAGRPRRAARLQCQLYAMVPLPDEEEEDEPEEPWAASVPGSSYEASLEESDEDEEDEDEPRVAPIPLGHIVRYERDRVHPESLPLEAVDLLRKIIDGETSEVVDRALADLLGL